MRGRQPRDPEGRMPLMDHLRELRSRLIKSLIAVALGVGLGFAVFDWVWAVLQAPYCALPQAVQEEDACQLIFTGVFDVFFVQLKVAVLVGIAAACPVWLWQIWQFVTPALRGRERRYSVMFIGAAVPLFLAGAALAYFIAELALRVMFGFAPEGVVDMITITSYLNYMVTIMLVFGGAFVLPLLVILLNVMGILSHQAIAKWRRVVIFVAFVFAAIVTPADPITMLILGGCLVLLFEIAELFAFLHDRRKRAGEPYADVGDDEISPLDIDGSDGPAEDITGPPATR